MGHVTAFRLDVCLPLLSLDDESALNFDDLVSFNSLGHDVSVLTIPSRRCICCGNVAKRT